MPLWIDRPRRCGRLDACQHRLWPDLGAAHPEFPRPAECGLCGRGEVYRSFYSLAPWPNRRESLQYSSDGGGTWTVPVVFDTAYYNPVSVTQPLACTRSRLLLATMSGGGLENPQARLERVHVATGTRQGQAPSIFRPIPDWQLGPPRSIWRWPPTPAAKRRSSVEMRGDRLGPGLYLGPYLHRTTDGGESWEPYIAMTNGEWVSQLGNAPANFCHGKLWVLAYQYCHPLTPEIFIHVWFSANHGKSWYPPSIAADSALDVEIMTGQFQGREVRLYWTQVCDRNGEWNYDFRTVAGEFTADTLPPVLSAPQVLPDTVALGDTLVFAVDVQENDTLYEVGLRLWSEAGLDTLLRLTGDDSCRWQGAFVIADSGHYHYRYEAEDFWEQRTSLARQRRTGVRCPGGAGGGSAGDLRPSAFELAVLPNPFNSTTEIRYAVPRASHVSLRVFDVMGREVGVLVDRVVSAGERARGVECGVRWRRGCILCGFPWGRWG